MKNTYTYEKLQIYCNENNIFLCENYFDKKLNRRIIIKAKCLKCSQLVEKDFRSFIDKGCYCNSCIFTKNNKQRYNLNYLQTYCFNNNITLLENYDIVNRETIIKAKCLSNNCKEIVEKTFRMIINNGGCYCTNCTTIKRIIKLKQTNLENYGVEYPLQHSDIAEKSSKNAYKIKKYIFPSGLEIDCQGYESFALDEIIKTVEEKDIITNRKHVPEIWYIDEYNKSHRHFVDIFIPSQNKCIEVKSTWTAHKKQDNIFKKQEAAKQLGYDYEIWIYDSKGNKIKCYV